MIAVTSETSPLAKSDDYLAAFLLAESLSSAAAPSKNCAKTSGPNASDSTAPPTADVDEKRPPI